MVSLRAWFISSPYGFFYLFVYQPPCKAVPPEDVTASRNSRRLST
jgi:hypothetical protein